MERAENKAERLRQIEDLLLSHPEGMSQAEIAARLGVHRSTVHRYLPALTHLYALRETDDGRLVIDRTSSQIRLSFTLNEALAVHLAARLMATRMDRQNPYAAAVLRKLGLALERLAPTISRHVLQSADVMDEAARRHDAVFLRALERLTQAWAEERKTAVKHRMEDTGRVYEYTFSPYFIEPYAVGQTTHVIGWREPPGALRTFKIERIESVELLNERYTPPASFDPRSLLSDAWSIWYTEAAPVKVVLRFSARVAARVRETRWHRSEQIEELGDGRLVWTAMIAEPKEMLPWVRGWGADCEALEPAELRAVLGEEIQRMAEVYGISRIETTTQYYAHSRPGEPRVYWQKLRQHLENTAALASSFGKPAGIAELAYLAGLLHDIGKYSTPFQARLEGAKKKVDHATAGAKTLLTAFPSGEQNFLAKILSYCVSGHHTGLLDHGSSGDIETDGTLLARLKKDLTDYSAYANEIEIPTQLLPPRKLKLIPNHFGFTFAFLTRLLYSCLVDADFQDTETYIQGAKPRGQFDNIAALADRFSNYLSRFKSPVREIDRRRTETLQACARMAKKPPGFFTLTVPTGGGKTLSSMAFALDHALEHGLERIIYVIPFTSIIEQNAQVFKECLGEGNVLEHHSSFDWSPHKNSAEADDQTRNALDKLRLATENWDIPIVVTTNVQFFESLFSNRSSACRKLHNIARSVIIFDEAQMLPMDFLQPCLYAVSELVQNYGATAVFCTATQPALEQLGFLPKDAAITELAPNPESDFEFYRRVHLNPLGPLTDEALLDKINRYDQALCIVNTRRHASSLFSGLAKEGRFHLSTLMCPAHRKEVLAMIRKRLADGLSCRVVSTQVMEAGIDIDFPVGFRALAGLDSMIQAAGRVNREGNLSSGEVYVFEPDSNLVKRAPAFIRQGAEVARSVLRNFASDPASIQAIQAYYTTLYNLHDEKRAFDTRQVLPCFEKDPTSANFDFETAAELFKLIDDRMKTIIIPYDKEAMELLEKVKYSPYPASFMRQLQLYTVNIYEKEFEALQSKGVVQDVANTFAFLDPDYLSDYYHPDTGVLIPEIGGDAIFM